MADEPEEQPEQSKQPEQQPQQQPKNEIELNGYEDFHNLFKGLKNERVALFSHRNPDPDAISSMMGMGWLLHKAYGLDSTMFYDGEVSHPQNGSMVNLLTPDMKRIEEYDSENWQMHICLDCIPENAGIGTNKIKFDVCIDHHKDHPHNFNNVLIHKKVGSSAAIIYDMMKRLVPNDKWFSDETDVDTKVATALMVGIITDTHYQMSDDCTEYDRCAFGELFEYRNSKYLHQIVFFKRSKFWVDRKAAAVNEAFFDEEGNAIVGLGLLPVKERDLISDMAEEMVTWSSVQTAIAFAVVGGDRIEGSVRSLNASLSVPDFCKKLGGSRGSGGGKQGKGAYNLSLSPSIDPDEDAEDAEEAWESIKKREIKRISRITKK
jgi:nanoRNase/pAp phosphatase (c-di-AMP/oligoRNAs hydrolase)